MSEVPQDEVELNLLKTGLGTVSQSDVEAAALAGASIFTFNVGGVPADVKVKDRPYLDALGSRCVRLPCRGVWACWARGRDIWEAVRLISITLMLVFWETEVLCPFYPIFGLYRPLVHVSLQFCAY